jgi:alkanesulfonate monooxygenase SsuD/methylene tetrahydromethanopterin reductase-like flavin-dependent oxidoreductase (luciferase family)
VREDQRVQSVAVVIASDEFLTVWRGIMSGETVDFAGEHLQVEGGRLLFSPVQHPHPPSISAARRLLGTAWQPGMPTST